MVGGVRTRASSARLYRRMMWMVQVRRRAVRRTGANVRGGCWCCNGSAGYDGRSGGRGAVGGARKHAQWGLRRRRDPPGNVPERRSLNIHLRK